MNDDLFTNLPEVKSPRLLWMEKHGITTRFKVSSEGVTWFAETDEGERMIQAKGATEHDSLVFLAIKLNLKLWNQ